MLRRVKPLRRVNIGYSLSGRQLIAGKWIAGETTFQSAPAQGPAYEFADGTAALVDQACEVAEDAFGHLDTCPAKPAPRS